MLLTSLPRDQEPIHQALNMKTIHQTSPEYKQLAQYLYYNLNKDFKQFYRSTSSTNSKANAAAVSNNINLPAEELEDRKVSFIAYVLPELVEKGATLASYKRSRQTIINSYRNMMIDMWRREQTERKHIVHLENIYSEDGEDMTPSNNIADTTEPYDGSIDKLWANWAQFVVTLSPKDKQLTLSLLGHTSAMLSKQLGIPERTVRYQVEKLRASFQTFCLNNK